MSQTLHRQQVLSFFARLWSAFLGLFGPRPLPEVPAVPRSLLRPTLRRPSSRLLLAELEGDSTPAGRHALGAMCSLQLGELRRLVQAGADAAGCRAAALAGLVARSPLAEDAAAALSQARALLASGAWTAPTPADVARLVVKPLPPAAEALDSLMEADELAAGLFAAWKATGRRQALVWRSLQVRIEELRQSFVRCPEAWLDRAPLAREILAFAPPYEGDLTLPLWQELAQLDQVERPALDRRPRRSAGAGLAAGAGR